MVRSKTQLFSHILIRMFVENKESMKKIYLLSASTGVVLSI